jgi:hypothetical protein
VKSLLELVRKRNRFTSCLRGATFGLLFTLAALVMAKTPPLDARKIGVDKTETTTRAGPTALQGTHVKIVPPFVGDHSETWEEFPVQKFRSSVISIFGGIATIWGSRLETATFGMFRLCAVYAKPSDGTMFMGATWVDGFVTISFSQPASAFGAYWGASDCGTFNPYITFTFFDANGNQVDTDSFSPTNGDPMVWRGYAFDTPMECRRLPALRRRPVW